MRTWRPRYRTGFRPILLQIAQKFVGYLEVEARISRLDEEDAKARRGQVATVGSAAIRVGHDLYMADPQPKEDLRSVSSEDCCPS